MLLPGPYGCGAGRCAAFPGSKNTLTALINQYINAAASAIVVRCPASARAGRYRSAKRRYPYMFLDVYIEESSISNHPDIEVETSISTFLQYRGTSISNLKYKTSISTYLQYRVMSISKYTNDDIDAYSFDMEVAYCTRYRRHKSKRRY